ncbi:MAG: ParB/RepB/Spo0J family partition protein [bacterium]|nr:ParB/RepB/Spo0J family partition protein [bacterium]
METIKRRALGMGLEELFNNEQLDLNKFEEKIVTSTPKNEIVDINLNELRPNPYQPRKFFDEEKLKELSDSIKEHGVFQPIIVKKSIKGYEIIAGERRVKASKLAGLEKIPSIIRDFSDEDMMEIALLENLQRENLNAIEEATAYNKLLETLKITQDELSKKLGKSRSHVTNMIGLLSLPSVVKTMISDGTISMSHARVLSKIKDENEIIKLANKIINENLSVREIEFLSQQKDFEKKHKIVSKKEKQQSQFFYLESSMSEKLGTKVKIKNNKLEISFTNINDLHRILEILNIKE